RRRTAGGEIGPDRLPRLLHERPLRARGGGALSRPRRRRGVVLRHVAGQRRRGEPTPLARQTARRALHLLRRARRARAIADGRRAPSAIRGLRRRRRDRALSRRASRFRVSTTLVLRPAGGRAALGASYRALSPPPRLRPALRRRARARGSTIRP